MVPSSQSMWSASRAIFACQKESAITATPEGTATILRTPAMERARESSKARTFAPKMGARATTAINIRGILTSMPKTAFPFTLSEVSSRFAGLPMSLNVFGSLSGTCAGGVNFAAASASCP